MVRAIGCYDVKFNTHLWFRNIHILHLFHRIVSHTIYANIIYCQVNETILKQTLFRFVYLRKLLLKLLELLQRFQFFIRFVFVMVK